MAGLAAGEEHAAELFVNLHALYQKGEGCDLTLLSQDGESFQVHSCVVLACIPGVRTGLASEGDGKAEMRVEVHGHHLTKLLDFVYMHHSDSHNDPSCVLNSESWESPESVISLIRAATQLGMSTLQEFCVQRLEKIIDMRTAITLFQSEEDWVIRSGCDVLSERFLLRHVPLSELCWPELLTPLSLERLLRNDRLNTPRELLAWRVVARWLQGEPDTRAEHLPRLLEALRLLIIPREDLETEVLLHPVVVASASVQALLKTIEGAPEGRRAAWAAPRMPHALVLVLGWVAPRGSITLYVLNPLTGCFLTCDVDRWLHSPVLAVPALRGAPALAEVDGSVYLCGGVSSTDNRPVSTCFRLEPRSLQWRPVCPMRWPRDRAMAVALGGRLLVVGGHCAGHGQRFTAAELYDPQNNCWQPFPLPEECSGRYPPTPVVLQDTLYLVGGCSSNLEPWVAHNHVLTLDPRSLQWSHVTSLKYPRIGARCVAYQGFIYAVGGYHEAQELRSVERYDAARGVWDELAPMLEARGNFGLTRVYERLYAVGWGGQPGGRPRGQDEVYDIPTNTWSGLGTAMCAHACTVTSCTVDDLDFSERVLTTIPPLADLWTAPLEE